MLKRLYDWTLELAGHRHARWALAGVSFVESSVFPIPPDIMLIPMVLAQRARAWALAAIAMSASVLGGMLGYAIGFFLMAGIGQMILGLYGLEEQFARFTAQYHEYGAWIVFAFGLTPLPYKLITIASGAAELNLGVFILSSIAARGLRFFAVTALLYWLGPQVRDFIEKRFGLAATLFVVLLFGGFLAVKFLL
jgi:membrane protein YqaA with SNARE-associated domain